MTTEQGGRPKIDRAKGIQLAISQIRTGKPSTQYACRVLKCSSKTFERLA
jgi:hypothetical protein